MPLPLLHFVSLPCHACLCSTACCSDGDKLVACKTSTGSCPAGYIPASLASNSADEQCWQAAANFTSCAKVSNRTLSLYTADSNQAAVLTRCIFRAPSTTNCSAITDFATSLTNGVELEGCYSPAAAGGATGKCPVSAVPKTWDFALYDRTSAASSVAVLTACLSGISSTPLSSGCGSIPGLAAAGYDAEVSASGVATLRLLGCVKNAACPTEYSKFLLNAVNATLDSCQTTLAGGACPTSYPVTMCSGDAKDASTTTGQCAAPDGCMAFTTATRCNQAATSSIDAYPRFTVDIPSLLSVTLKSCFKASTACPASGFTNQAKLPDNSIQGCTSGTNSDCQTFWRTVSGINTLVCA